MGPGSSACLSEVGGWKGPWFPGTACVEIKEEVMRPNAVLSLLSSLHTCPALLGTSCPTPAFPLLFSEPFCLLEGPEKPSPQIAAPHRSHRQSCPQLPLLWPGPSWQGMKSKRREGQPETASCHGSSWHKGGSNARKRLTGG